MITKWEPTDFKLETNSIWSFPDRGNWATHDSKYRGNWSPYIPRNLILRYSKEKDLLLDPFAGGGTSLVEAKLLNRNMIGIDVNPEALKICKQKCNFEREKNGKVNILKGDARNLDFIKDESIDLICTHPPYANIIKYSKDIKEDISHFKVQDFLSAMKKVASENYRVLKNDKFCAVLIGDIRKKGFVVPLSFDAMQIYLNTGFKLKEIIIKGQHNCKMTEEWKSRSLKYNFLLLAHEHLFVFKK